MLWVARAAAPLLPLSTAFHAYPKPLITVCHVSRSLFAMPECGIGLFTDVAGALFLSAIPGEMGTYLALTGGRLTGSHPVRASLQPEKPTKNHLFCAVT